jgi:hypothetical protein
MIGSQTFWIQTWPLPWTAFSFFVPFTFFSTLSSLHIAKTRVSVFYWREENVSQAQHQSSII